MSGRKAEGQGCSRFAVGISNIEKVRDDQITASSSLGEVNRPWHARLGETRGDGWCAAQGRARRQYLEIDLEKDFVFCGITVQGGFHGHVDDFELEFARQKGGAFTPYGRVFTRDHQDEEEEEFYPIGPFPVGRIIRFYPVLVTGFTCARIELYGFPGPKVTCAPEYMIAEFKKSYYPDLVAPEMNLKNTSCLAESENATYITFHIPFRACGTIRIQTNDYLEYTNEVLRHITVGIITYKMNLNFPITCKYDRNVTLDDVNFEVRDDETTASPTTAVFVPCTFPGGFTGKFEFSFEISS
ncbi:hypothetical protein ACROYT_G041645 [Oculina patagonica]